MKIRQQEGPQLIEVTGCLNPAEYIFLRKIAVFQIKIEVVQILADIFLTPFILCNVFSSFRILFLSLHLLFPPFSLPVPSLPQFCQHKDWTVANYFQFGFQSIPAEFYFQIFMLNTMLENLS